MAPSKDTSTRCFSEVSNYINGSHTKYLTLPTIEEVRISNRARSPQEFNLQLPPTSLTAGAAGTSVNLRWQNGGGGLGLLRYKIYRGSDSTNVSLVDSTTSTSYTNAGLTAGARYFYRVSAVDLTGFESAKSHAASAWIVFPAEYQADANTVLLLHMNESSGSTVTDASTNGNSGYAWGTTVANGRFGSSRQFTSTDSIVISRNILGTGNADFSVEAWIFATSYPAVAPAKIWSQSSTVNPVPRIEGLIDGGGRFAYSIYYATGGWGQIFTSGSCPLNKWTHIAVTRDSATHRTRLYINGKLDKDDNSIGPQMTSYLDRFSLGGSQFTGRIDEFRVTNRVRLPQEFNLQLPPTNLRATVAGNGINLIWQNGGGAVGLLRYKMYRGSDSTNVSAIDSAVSTVYSDVSVQASGVYFYRVSAVDSTGFEGAKSYAVRVQIPLSLTLSAVSPSSTLSGSDFWVDIKVADSLRVTNLFGISFNLAYSNTSYIDFVSADTAGSFLGRDLLCVITPNDASGIVGIGLSLKAPAAGVSGGGTLLRVKFRVASSAPIGGTVTFSFSNLSANDSSGTPISLWPISSTTNIVAGVVVWPGDTDTSGVVNQGDILPLGLHWGRTGVVRPNASIQWIAQLAIPWVPQSATYADANGDGVVNQADVLPIGLNWGKTHTLGKVIVSYSAHQQRSALNTLGTPILRAIGPQSVTGKTDFDVYISVGDSTNAVSNLFGISFVLDFAGSKGVIQAVETTQGTLLGSDVIFFPQVDNVNGNVAFGITRKAGQNGVTGSGQLAKVRFKILNQTNIVTFSTRDIVANDPNGNAISILPSSSSILVSAEIEQGMPDRFSLSQNYPNPFNPSTRIAFSIAKTTRVELRVLDVLGRNVALLVDGEKQPGSYEVEWRAGSLPSGVYLYRLQAGEFVETKRMLLLK